MVGLILCAGRGTRLKVEMKDKPKCMADVGGKPVLERIGTHLNKYGVWKIVVNLSFYPEVVMNFFGQRFLYLFEPVPIGEMATTNIVKGYFPGESLLVVNGDTITDFFPGVGSLGVVTSPSSDKKHNGYTLHEGEKITKYYDYERYFIDIGTPEGLKKARDLYEL